MSLKDIPSLKPLYKRVSDWEYVREAIDEIPYNRITTLLDLDNCFYADNIKARGFVGAAHLLGRDKLQESLQKSVNEGMFLKDIPSTLAKEPTQRLLISTICGHLAAQGMVDDDPDAVNDAFEYHLKHNYSRLQLIYVGDYIEHIKKHQSPRLNIAADILWGNGHQLKSIIQALKDLPSYDEFADPGRKPPAQKQKEEGNRPLVWRPAYNP